MQYKLETRV